MRSGAQMCKRVSRGDRGADPTALGVCGATAIEQHESTEELAKPIWTSESLPVPHTLYESTAMFQRGIDPAHLKTDAYHLIKEHKISNSMIGFVKHHYSMFKARLFTRGEEKAKIRG